MAPKVVVHVGSAKATRSGATRSPTGTQVGGRVGPDSDFGVPVELVVRLNN